MNEKTYKFCDICMEWTDKEQCKCGNKKLIIDYTF